MRQEGVHEALESLTIQKVTKEPAANQVKSIALVDIGEIYRRYILWKKRLGRVEGFYGESELIYKDFITHTFKR